MLLRIIMAISYGERDIDVLKDLFANFPITLRFVPRGTSLNDDPSGGIRDKASSMFVASQLI